VVDKSSVVQFSLDRIMHYENFIPQVSFRDKSQQIPFNETSLILQIEKKGIQHPLDYQYYFQINGKDTIPLIGKDIYLMNLSSGEYLINLYGYSTFNNEWHLMASHSFIKEKAPWERWYNWLLVASAFTTIIVVIYFRRKVAKAKITLLKASLEKELAHQRLLAIQAKMNPHFMFNALNSIQNYIIDADTDNALLYLSEFAKLMRQTVDYSSLTRITLAEEIDFLERYIRIEQMRFTSAIRLEKNIEDGVSNFEIPPMILQPLIENAFIHGMDTNSKTVQIIELSIQQVEPSKLLIKISNHKINRGKSPKTHPSFGITSIEQRLKLLNPSNTMTIHDSVEQFIVQLEIGFNVKS
jgi:hypothetical protein